MPTVSLWLSGLAIILIFIVGCVAFMYVAICELMGGCDDNANIDSGDEDDK